MADRAAAQEHKSKGNAFLQQGAYEKAIEAYTKAIELDPNDHVFFSNRSAAYLSHGDATSALKDAEQCVGLKPDWPKGFSRKGAALHALQRWKDAEEAYDAGLTLDPHNQALQDGRAEVARAESSASAAASGMPANPFGPDMFAKLALDPKMRGYLEDPAFRAKLQQLQTNPSAMMSTMGEDPRMLEVLSYLWGIPLTAGAGAGAAAESPQEEAARPAPKEEPKEPPAPPKEETPEEREARERKERADARKSEGNVHYRKKDFDEALRCYDEALEIEPNDITYRLNKAAVYFEQGDLDKSIKECEEAIEFGREHRAPFALLGKAFMRIGNCHMKRQDYEAAIESYNSSLTESHIPGVEDRLKKAKQLLKKKQEQEYLDPEKAEEAKNKGNEAFKEGKFVDAIEHYTEAIRRNPEVAVYWANRATARTKVIDLVAAYNDASKALQIDPKYVKAWARKGNIEFLQKEFHKALDSFRKGLEIDSENSECAEGMRRTVAKINEGGQPDEERLAKAAADPEIQSILRDPMVSQVLRDLQSDPSAAQRVMRDPSMASKIEKLVAAGVVQTR